MIDITNIYEYMDDLLSINCYYEIDDDDYLIKYKEWTLITIITYNEEIYINMTSDMISLDTFKNNYSTIRKYITDCIDFYHNIDLNNNLINSFDCIKDVKNNIIYKKTDVKLLFE